MTTPPAPRPGPRRRGLGRGLEALLGPSTDAPPGEPTGPSPAEALLLEIDAALVDPNPEQPRREFDQEALEALSESIRVHGLLHPIVVERAGTRFQLVAGERRLRAARLAGLKRILAIVRPAAESARESLETALTENLLRADLSPIEEAVAYSRLADTFGLSHDAIALRLGRSRPAVSNTIRLLSLPAPVQQAVADGRISAGHGRALLALPSGGLQETYAKIVHRGGWSVRQTEQQIKRLIGMPVCHLPPPRLRRLTVDDEALRRGVEQRLGLPVTLERRGEGGRVIVSFESDEDLDALYRRIGGAQL